MALARAERADLAALLRELTPEQWEAPSLCTEWPVRDVVAHVVSYEELDTPGLLRRYARGRFVPRRVNAVGVADYAGHRPDQLIEVLDRHLRPRGLTAGFGGRIALVDGVIHQQDIRRPWGSSATSRSSGSGRSWTSPASRPRSARSRGSGASASSPPTSTGRRGRAPRSAGPARRC